MLKLVEEVTDHRIDELFVGNTADSRPLASPRDGSAWRHESRLIPVHDVAGTVDIGYLLLALIQLNRLLLHGRLPSAGNGSGRTGEGRAVSEMEEVNNEQCAVCSVMPEAVNWRLLVWNVLRGAVGG